jgi:SAM-dependent methyltransferase/methyltransferase-like protein
VDAAARYGEARTRVAGSLEERALHGGENLYDAVPYPSLAFDHTHPDQMAAMATLHGLDPAPVEHCRVLEIACGEGGNLIPMAYAIPGSEFVGFDLAGLPIERGQGRIRELGLENIRIFQADLMNVGAELGQFDYIIAHGLYAWVPEAVSERALGLCAESLTANGIAFISYNTLPGGYVRNIVRETLLDRVTGGGDVERQVKDGIAFLRSLLSARPENDAFRVLIEGHLEKMDERNANAVFHDEFSAVNRPMHFTEFAERAARHGLQYVSEAVLPPPPDPSYKFELRSAIDRATGGDLLKQEQLLDVARVRKYREDLLCRASCEVQRDFTIDRFKKMLLRSEAASAPAGDSAATAFKLPSGIKMESNHPAVTMLLRELEGAWPHALSFAELEPRIERETGYKFDSDGAALLMRLAISKFVDLHRWSAPLAKEIGERPRASAYARQEIRTGSQATSLLHILVKLEDAVSRRLLGLLDGTRNRGELAAMLIAEFPEMSVKEIEEGIEAGLRVFYRAGFLEV